MVVVKKMRFYLLFISVSIASFQGLAMESGEDQAASPRLSRASSCSSWGTVWDPSGSDGDGIDTVDGHARPSRDSTEENTVPETAGPVFNFMENRNLIQLGNPPVDEQTTPSVTWTQYISQHKKKAAAVLGIVTGAALIALICKAASQGNALATETSTFPHFDAFDTTERPWRRAAPATTIVPLFHDGCLSGDYWHDYLRWSVETQLGVKELSLDLTEKIAAAFLIMGDKRIGSPEWATRFKEKFNEAALQEILDTEILTEKHMAAFLEGKECGRGLSGYDALRRCLYSEDERMVQEWARASHVRSRRDSEEPTPAEKLQQKLWKVRTDQKGQHWQLRANRIEKRLEREQETQQASPSWWGWFKDLGVE